MATVVLVMHTVGQFVMESIALYATILARHLSTYAKSVLTMSGRIFLQRKIHAHRQTIFEN